MAQELLSLGIATTPETGGVSWQGSALDIMRANLYSRTSSRLLVRIASFNARTFHELERRSRTVDWSRYVHADRPALLRVTCRKSRLYHEGAVAQRLHEAIAERAGASSAGTGSEEVDAADVQLFVVRLFRDRCTISADSSGERLHRRGYRQALAKAPLRETIAAAMLLASGWDRRSPLIDPLCGSGTIAIEAALLSRNIPPGLALAEREPRSFAFTRWADFDDGAWQRVLAGAKRAILPDSPATIIASDRMSGAIRAARANAERAGVLENIEFAVHALTEVRPRAGHGWLVTNPPWGKRAGSGGDAARTAHELNLIARERLPDWTVARLLPDRGVASAPRPAFSTQSGGVRVGLYVETLEH